MWADFNNLVVAFDVLLDGLAGCTLRSFSPEMAALIMSTYGGCSGAFAAFFGFAAGLDFAEDLSGTVSDMLQFR